MGMFDSVMEGLFGSDGGADQLEDIVNAQLDFADNQNALGQGGFDMANLLMPTLLESLGITAQKDKDGNIIGFERTESAADKLRGKLEMTTLKKLDDFYQGKGAIPIGVAQRNKAAQQGLRSQMRKSGFGVGDTPFQEARGALRADIAAQNDAFRHGQFANAANMMNMIDQNQRGDLSTFLTGAMSAQQSPLPWLNSMISNTGALSGAAQGAGSLQGQPGLLGQVLGAYLAGGCWVARAVYGNTNPDWIRFRFWLVSRAPLWLSDAYRKYGQRLAAWIHKCPAIGTMLRPLMDRVI